MSSFKDQVVFCIAPASRTAYCTSFIGIFSLPLCIILSAKANERQSLKFHEQSYRARKDMKDVPFYLMSIGMTDK